MASGFWDLGVFGMPRAACRPRSLWVRDQSVVVFLAVAYWAGRPGLRWSCRVSLRR